MKFDEIILNTTTSSRSYTMTKKEITEYASQFDPQFMHINEEKAKDSIFGGIIASGLHTLSVSFKLWVEEHNFGDDIIAGTTIDNLRFVRPVYPEDILHTKAKVIAKKGKKKRGEVTLLVETFKNDSELVITYEMSALVAR